MNTVVAFLDALAELQIKVWREGQELCFKAPKGALTQALRSELAARKAEILASLPDQTFQTQAEVELLPVSRDQPLPLSFTQQRLWFLEQLDGPSATYNLSAALRLEGPLHQAALTAAFNWLVARHESLRTTFELRLIAGEEQPVQVIHREATAALDYLDLQSWQGDAQAAELQRVLTAAMQQPFDLGRLPLSRALLLQLDAQTHILGLVQHHIIADGWSISVLLQELGLCYDALLAGHPPALPALTLQYADFAYWQRQRLQGAVLEQQLAYWKTQLRGAPALLALPTDRPRPAVQRFHGGCVYFALEPRETAALKQLGESVGATLFMTLYAVFAVLLSRLSGQADLVIGTPIANRTQRQLETLIGFFANTLVLRLQLPADATFLDVLALARQTALDAYAHQEVPFEQLVDELHPERSLSYSALFQAMFIFHNVPAADLRLTGLHVSPLALAQIIARFDLTLLIEETPSGLQGRFEYNSDLFDHSTIERLSGHFQNLLRAGVATPQRPVTQLPLLTVAEQQQLLAWNQTACAYPQQHTVVALFEQQVLRSPDAIAASDGQQALSYRDLNAQANQLAQYLRSLGVQPDSLVGVYLERSVSMLVGLLGILKAGAAYLPLDPIYPAARVVAMLDDAQAPWLLTQSDLSLPPCQAAQPIFLDQLGETLAQQSTDNPEAGAAPSHLAYVIYTSGSTGKPKGVQISHQALVNFLWAMRSAPGLSTTDKLLAVTTLSFDIAGLELYLPLIVGAQVVIASREQTADGALLAEVLHNQQITLLQATPATWRLLLDSDWAGSTQLMLISGGEALPGELAARLLPRCKALWNLYGPTETTIWSMAERVNAELLPDILYIGRPIANTQIYILDAQGQAVPIGVPGELYIGGDGLARGYFQRPELTAEKFITVAADAGPPLCAGSRLYRTGDLARYLADGRVEYLGRIDNQVKLRGFRIELGEIEAVLAQHPSVREAVLLLQDDAQGHPRLQAYVVAAPDETQAEQSAQQIAQWQAVWSEAYQQHYDASADPGFNTSGWQDSYTGQPIPLHEMREWRDATLAQIVAWSPQRVLEIGCGTGMLLFHIAPHCAHYTGTDISAEALRYIRQHLSRQTWRERISLYQTAADQLADCGIDLQSRYDLVILNSVIQYFPSVDYLLAVLSRVINLLAPGGRIFVGDVRNLHWLEAFHAAIQATHAQPTDTWALHRQRVQNSLRREQELLLDPDFFLALPQQFPQISQVQIELKRGRAHNEMTQFRYDVTLHLQSEAGPRAAVQWRDWSAEPGFLAQIPQLIANSQADILGFRQVPNARLLTEMAWVEQLAQAPQDALLGEFPSRSLSGVEGNGIEPDDFRDLLPRLAAPHSVFVLPTATRSACFDVIFQRKLPGQTAQQSQLPRYQLGRQVLGKAWQRYANQPLRSSSAAPSPAQISAWRDFLKQRLPDYMVPAAFVVLDTLPLTPNGKTDRRALATWQVASHTGSSTAFVAPRTPEESLLADIWGEVLKLAQVGVHDNFFDLGGHSLLATQVVARVRDSFNVALPLRELFQNPTVAELSVRISQMRRVQPLPPIQPVDRSAPLPLSFAQQRLWFLAQLEGPSATYNIPLVLRLHGRLDQPALVQSLTALSQRHESLRASFPSVAGKAQVQIHPSLIPLDHQDLRALPQAEQAAAVQQHITDHAAWVFDCEHGPLFRVTCLTLADDSHYVLFNLHHLIADGWSIGVLLRDWTRLYQAACQQQTAVLPELPVQVVDFAAWQRDWLQGSVLAQQVAYWQQQLAGIPVLLELPCDYPRPPQQRFHGASVAFSLSAPLTQALKQLSRQAHTTLFATLLSAFAVLLARHSRQTDLVIGTPIANRTQTQIEGLIGLFVNTLALRLDLSADPSFAALLQQAKQVTLDAYSHQDVPFEQLLEVLQPTRALSHSPVFQVLFALQNAPMPSDLNLSDGLTATLEEPGSFSAKFDLSLVMEESEQGMVAGFEYNTDLFSRARIERLAGHFVILLTGLVAQPQQPISRLPLLTAAEQQQQAAWNATAVAYPLETVSLVSLFETQVAANPERPALWFDEQTLTYQQLNARANQLARRLRELGVDTETRVGVCLERSLELVIALWGILKAGGAYVPLDPEYPSERLAFMLEDSQVPVLLTRTSLLAGLPPHRAQVLCLDKLDLSAYSADNLSIAIAPAQAAYLIYTSGSTGKPKGVINTQRGICNRLLWMQDAYGLNASDTVLQKTPASFDVSVWEFFWPLITGARLVLAKPGGHRDSQYLLTLIAHTQVTTLHFVPSMLQAFIEEERLLSGVEASAASSLKRVITSGEALPFELQQRFFQRLPHVELHNLYGPTEAAVDVTYWPCRADSGLDFVPIGRPIANIQIEILDAALQTLPIGVPGELHIGGVGLARGYLNRPELTAEKFITLDNGVRLYKTGDLACWLADGNIQYLGRLDNQIKLRGFRIELGEVEAVLGQHPAVKAAVVTVYSTNYSKRLVAYLTCQNDPLKVDELRRWLAARLPEYMVPANFLILDSLPLTPNGKVDRKALPDPTATQRNKGFAVPRNGLEQQLVEIWAKVLKRPTLGIHDNFFELGGDSILSIQIVALARQAGLGLSPRDLFQHQNIAELAQAVKPVRQLEAEQGAVQGIVPLLPIQAQFLASDTQEPWHYNQAMLLYAPENLRLLSGVEALTQALATVLAHHDALRLRYQWVDGVWQQTQGTASAEDSLIHETVPSFTDAAFIQRATDWQASLNLTSGPLTRLVYFTTPDGEARLLWIIHHLLVDGVSWRILWTDLQQAYQAALASAPLSTSASSLPQKTSSFKAWSQRLQAWSKTAQCAADATYWRALPLSELVNPGLQSAEPLLCDIQLETALTRRLLEETPAAYHTGINDLLLSALLLALQTLNGQTQALIDLESHGRVDGLFPDLDLSRTVGWFTTLYPVWLSLPASGDLGQVIKQLKEQLRQVPHEGLAYGLLRQAGETLPQGQILWNYLGQLDRDGASGAFTLAPESTGRSHSLTGSRSHALVINAYVFKGQLSLNFDASRTGYTAAAIQTLTTAYQQHLQALIAHCRDHSGYTPSDFPLAALDPAQLEALTARYPRNLEAIYPLSPMQQGMLFHSLYAPDSGQYFEQLHCRLHGSLEVELLHQAWQTVLARHAILRTAFYHASDTPLQLVCKQVSLPWTVLDWQTLSPAAQDQQREILLQQTRQQGFDLSQPPLLRVQLVRLGAAEFLLLLHHHHILMDGWCLPMLFSDLLESYSALRAQRPPTWSPVPAYQRYIAWLGQQDRQAAQQYWQSKLAGFSAPTLLPIARHSTAAHPQATTLSHQLSADTTSQLEQLGRRLRVTLNTLIQAAWASLLGRYSGTQEVVFGVTTSGRNLPLDGVNQMLGLFINTLPLRARLDQDLPSLLHELQQQQQQDNHYAYTSLADIQQWSDVPNGTPLFESILVFESYPMDVTDSSLPFTVTDVQTIEYTHYPLMVMVMPGAQLHFKLAFDQNRYSADSIQRLLNHLAVLLQGMLDQPEAAVLRLPMLSAPEIALLQQWNQTAVDYPADQTLVDLFEQQAEKNPDQIAVVFQKAGLQATVTCNYRDLNTQANQLARHLQHYATGNFLVGIYLERSLDLLVGLLGILKAGAAYVPLDPSYPVERLAFMLEDSQVPVLLSQRALQTRLPAHQAQVLYLDDAGLFAAEATHNLVRQSGPDDLAYVIYTSGSTGKPKGTLLTHRGFTNYLHWALDYYAVTAGSGAPVQSSLAFDATITSLYLPLLAGKTTVLLPEREEIEALAETLRQGPAFSLIKITPAHLEILNQQLQPADFPRASRALVLGGEALTSAHIQPWLRHAPDTHLINEYGPTETVVGCCVYDAKGQSTLHGAIPIGQPIANTQIYVVDQQYQPQPLGIPGELCIAGAGLARGYLNRPELTAEKFITVTTDSPPLAAGTRLYKTGDLARWLPDGNLEYLGRLDHQIKLRGFRIELGEIEMVLSQHPAVKEAVVLVYTGSDAAAPHKRLVAYLTLEPDAVSVDALRTWLKSRLPDYMVPANLLVLDTMPLTPNGKIDRKALAAHTPDDSASNCAYVAPENAQEQVLAEIWQALLGVARVSRDDNFFELGGDSIIAMKLMARAAAAGWHITAKQIFHYQTLAELAAVAQGAAHAAIPRLAAQPDYPLSHAQRRLWLLDQVTQHTLTYNIHGCLSLHGDFNREAFAQALAWLVNRHQALRTRFITRDMEPRQQVLDTLPLPLESLDFSHQADPESAVLAKITEQAATVFDLSKGPLLQVVLIKQTAQQHYLIVTLHHIISDGWSMEVFSRDLFTAYQAYLQGHAPLLAPLPIQYPDYAAWQQQQLQQSSHHQLKQYWQNQLAAPLPRLNFPSDYPRPPLKHYNHTATLSLRIDQPRLLAMQQLANQSQSSLFMLLVAGVSVLFYRHTAQTDLIIGTAVAGREQMDLENQIGFYVNLLPMRTRTQGTDSFRQVLQQAQHTIVELQTHQAYPFDCLLEDLNLDKDLSHFPLFDIAVDFQKDSQFETVYSHDCLRITPYEKAHKAEINLVDLAFFFVEQADNLKLRLTYDQHLFKAETIQMLLTHFEKILDSVLTQPDLSIAEIPLTTAPSVTAEADLSTSFNF